MPETALTIGNFDGVHAGHAALVTRARRLVGPGGRVVALCFDPHPLAVLRPAAAPARLTTFARRAELLRDAGADEVARLDPDPGLLNKTPEEFAGWLVGHYSPTAIVEGDDFHFGKARAGNVQTLAELGARLGFNVEVVGPVQVSLGDHLVVRASSSIIRWLVQEGRVRDAAAVLGRPYELAGEVVQGDQRGRLLGYPTANLKTECLLPADGVYAAEAVLPGGRIVAAAVNVGTRPTFDGLERRAEAYLMEGGRAAAGVPGYGWGLMLRLMSWLRDDARFDSVDSLISQIGRDCERAARVLRLGAGRFETEEGIEAEGIKASSGSSV
jgi:riboflavin kinase/FMN adenylyltransferase